MHPVATAWRGFKMVLFTASHGNIFVGGKCTLSSVKCLLVVFVTVIIIVIIYLSCSCLVFITCLLPHSLHGASWFHVVSLVVHRDVCPMPTVAWPVGQ